MKVLLMELLSVSAVCFSLQAQTVLSQAIAPSPPAVVVEQKAALIAPDQESSTCDTACARLAVSLPGQVFLGNSGDFDLWDAKQSDLAPACRIEPGSPADVSTIIKTVVGESCHFAIKSGGHDRTEGSSNAKGGVTIDLTRFKGIDVAKDRKSVKVGSGNRWLDVYSALEPQGLMVIGGRVATVGVGGLLLGGGLSFYSSRHGLGCDSVISYEIVLPDGTIKIVDQKRDPDLFLALRGAGNSNFGVIASFTLETIPLPNTAGLWDACKLYSWDKVSELNQLHYKHYTEGVVKDFDVGGWNVYSYFQPYDAFWTMTRQIHTRHTSNETWPEVFAPYKDVEALPGTTFVLITPFSNITIGTAEPCPSGQRNIYGTFTYRPSVEFDNKIAEIFHEEITQVKHIDEIQPNVVTSPLSRRTLSMMSKNGGNAMGLEESDGPLVILNVAWRWTHARDDKENFDAYYRMMDRMETEARKMKLWHPWKYINYADSTQDVWAGYGADNLQRLKQTQRRIDPARIFTKGGLASGFFKLNAKDEEVEIVSSTGRKSEL